MIRHAVLDDAENLARLIKQVEKSSEYMLFEPGERNPTAEKQGAMIKALTEQDNSCILLAEGNHGLVGYLFAIGGTTKRTMHRAYIVIGILSTYRGKGIGTALFKELNQWATHQGIHRLELTVVTENEAGVSLYQKAGFELEGVKKDSLFINNRFVDEYYMGKVLNNGGE
ncbi:GNAT family N-acetyltransferase [Ornithinibacillus sp. L9]|uniref:GNAT family N-acetyltransferase n=1 Tax=Ornithinibacillus caprae TaxID=2678566 RepID=A0A6N8FPN4_9BACI|nr:GNAT family protein [Ornithinibacillus caprae]MUK89829.1 GNAT family N-acetyltransferase [Ornithinibacillus caprae]